ncbi:MAG: SpoIID/LytB domain-containing protein [Leptolyngbya sp. SIO4C1]|nr:SpoIID/LytB domain-containing protein [Leptolyngbya sp. SIO4C1]
MSKRRLNFRVAALALATGLLMASAQASAQKPEVSAARSGESSRKPSGTTRMEPFIEADAIAIGKWLVAQKLQALTKTQKVPAAQKPAEKAKAASGPVASRNAASSSTPSARPPAPERRPMAPINAPAPPAPSEGLTIDNALEMRVALIKAADFVAIATSNDGAIVSLDGEGLKGLAANQSYSAMLSGGGLAVDGEAMPGAVWVQSNGGYVAVGNRWYRGRVLLLLRPSGILAVNYVMLNEYLYSVVGAEMSPSWPLESLKAQAVAARSYALVHNVRHSGRDYDLDDTTRYQAYRGIATETNTTQAAVQATAGEFISHEGGIVESLYAATQDIVNDAHSGFGMSQTGALDLSQQGYQYHEILGFYYPQTAVGRLDISE